MTNQLTLVPRGRRCRRFAAVVAVALALLAASSFEPSPAASPRIGLILNEPEAFEGYTLFNRRRSKAVYLIDNLGRLVHQWNLSTPTVFAKLLENGNLLVSGSDKINEYYDGVREVDPDGNVVWDYVHVGQHHDFVKLPNGNVLLLSEETRTVTEAVAAGANPRITVGDRLRATRVVEVRPTGPADGEIVWEWSAWDHLVQDFDSGKPNYGVVARHPELIDLDFPRRALAGWRDPWDWMHTNAIDYHPDLDQIMLSPRNFGELWIIDHSTTPEESAGHTGGNGGKGGDLLYRWGNPRSYRAGTVEDQQLFGQHNTHWIPDGLPGAGNILIFNNGFEFYPGRNYSSIEEIAPPVDGYGYRMTSGSAYGPDEPVWTYVMETPTDFHAPFISGVQRLPNGNTLICSGTNGTLFEVTPEGRTVWKYVNPVTSKGPLRQGEPIPVVSRVQGPGGVEVDVKKWIPGARIRDNFVFRAHRYARTIQGSKSWT